MAAPKTPTKGVTVSDPSAPAAEVPEVGPAAVEAGADLAAEAVMYDGYDRDQLVTELGNYELTAKDGSTDDELRAALYGIRAVRAAAEPAKADLIERPEEPAEYAGARHPLLVQVETAAEAAN
jgi:hypothetical protein